MKQVSYFIFIFIAQFVLIKEKRPVEGGEGKKKKSNVKYWQKLFLDGDLDLKKCSGCS